jgi:DNA-directed RNA polymerase specialized sigma24 family protein
MQASLSTSLLFSKFTQDQQTFAYEQAFAESLFDKYSGLLFGVIIRIVKDTKVAEEILKEVIFQMATETRQSVSTHLNPVTRMTQLAKAKAREKSNATSPGATPIASSDFIQLLLLKLSDTERQLVEWIILEGKSQKEVAQLLNLPLAVVRSKTRAAMLKVQEWMG